MSTNGSLAAYFAAVKRLPLLSPDEERHLARRYRETGDERIAQRLVEAHLRLVVKIASRYRWTAASLEDLVEEGNVGLMLAVARFDPERGVRLSSYAGWWIRALILRFLLDNHRLVRIGKTGDQRRIAFRLARARRELAEELGRAPDDAELAERLDVSPRAVARVGSLLDRPEIRLDAEPDDGQPPPARLVEAEERRPDHVAAERELARLVSNAANAFARKLRGRDAAIFRARWMTEEPPSLASLGGRFGISRERTRQLEARLLDQFRRFLARSASLDELRAAA